MAGDHLDSDGAMTRGYSGDCKVTPVWQWNLGRGPWRETFSAPSRALGRADGRKDLSGARQKPATGSVEIVEMLVMTKKDEILHLRAANLTCAPLLPLN
jgi:hypothetical protein